VIVKLTVTVEVEDGADPGALVDDAMRELRASVFFDETVDTAHIAVDEWEGGVWHRRITRGTPSDSPVAGALRSFHAGGKVEPR
jgi:hypothetical protein